MAANTRQMARRSLSEMPSVFMASWSWVKAAAALCLSSGWERREKGRRKSHHGRENANSQHEASSVWGETCGHFMTTVNYQQLSRRVLTHRTQTAGKVMKNISIWLWKAVRFLSIHVFIQWIYWGSALCQALGMQRWANPRTSRTSQGRSRKSY